MPTLTAEQVDHLFEEMFARMVEKGWLKRFVVAEGGWRLEWTEKGAAASRTLKRWAEQLSILDGDDHASLLSELAYEGTPGAGDPVTIKSLLRSIRDAGYASAAHYRPQQGCTIIWTAEGRAFSDAFIAMTDDLAIRGDADRLLLLFHIADEWAPGPEPHIRPPQSEPH